VASLLEELNFLSNWRHSNGHKSKKLETSSNRTQPGVTSQAWLESSNKRVQAESARRSSASRSGLVPRAVPDGSCADYYGSVSLFEPTHRSEHNAVSLKAMTQQQVERLCQAEASPDTIARSRNDRHVLFIGPFKRPCVQSRLRYANGFNSVCISSHYRKSRCIPDF